MKDYPAAHSMDTTWFAVDADGKVGRFESSEDGAVPLAAALAWVDPSFDVFLLDAVCAARVLATPNPEREPMKEFTQAGRAVVVIEPTTRDGKTDYRSMPASEPPIDGIVLREAEPRIIATKERLDAIDLGLLAEHPDVREVWPEGDLWALLDDVDRGLFDFRHEDHGNPGSYTRIRVPEKSMAVANLPAAIREDVAKLALPIKFAETEWLHLSEHLDEKDVQTWGDIGLHGNREPPPRPTLLPRTFDWRRILILLLAVLGIAWLLSRK